jgi:hypothetical protein
MGRSAVGAHGFCLFGSAELGGPIRNQVGSGNAGDGQVIQPSLALDTNLTVLRFTKDAGEIPSSFGRLCAANLGLLAHEALEVLLATQGPIDAWRADLKPVGMMNNVGHIQGGGQVPAGLFTVFMTDRKAWQNVRGGLARTGKVRRGRPVEVNPQNPTFDFPIPLQLDQIEARRLDGGLDQSP